MFYAEPLLVRKGQFSHLWLAAHWEKKLTKAHVVETDVVATVRTLLDEPVKLALRTSGHLLLGVVRIFARKLKYLLTDCNEVHVKIKVAFRPGVIDLPADQGKDGQLLPDLFSEFDMGLTNLSDLDWQAKFAMNQARDEDITLPMSTLPQAADVQPNRDDADFGELTEDSRKLLSEEVMMTMDIEMGVDASTKDFLPAESDIGFGSSKLLFEQADQVQPGMDLMDVDEAHRSAQDQPPEDVPPPEPIDDIPPDPPVVPDPGLADETTLVPADTEAFVLEPLNSSSKPGAFAKPIKRKRALLVDDQLQLSNDQIRNHLRDPSEIVQRCHLAPRTKRASLWAEHGSAETLFTTPSSNLTSLPGSAPMFPAKLMNFYKANCRSGKPPLNVTFNKSATLDDTTASTEEMRAGDQTSDLRAGDDTTLNEPLPVEYERDEMMPFEEIPFEPLPQSPEKVHEPEESTDEMSSKRRRYGRADSAVLDIIREEADSEGRVSFEQICTAKHDKKDANVSMRKTAARTFQAMLLLVREGKVTLEQDKPFDAITACC